MMEDDSSLITFSDEYRLLEAYHQRRKIRDSRLRAMAYTQSKSDDKTGDVAEKLTQIVDSGLLIEDGVEPDSPDGDVVDRLVVLLKASGDDLNKKIQMNHDLLGYLQNSFCYSSFERLTTAFIKSAVPEYQKSARNPEKIALTFEVTSRLKALDLHPMSRVMGFGAQYLQEHFTPWVQQHGGWEKTFDVSDDEVH